MALAITLWLTLQFLVGMFVGKVIRSSEYYRGEGQ